MSRIQWRQVVIAFLLGSILTAAICQVRRDRWTRPDPKTRYERMLEKFNRTLKLTGDQKIKVAAIFETQRQKIDALREETSPRFEAVRQSASVEIRQLLTEEQKLKFDEMEKKHAEMRRRWLDSRGPPPK